MQIDKKFIKAEVKKIEQARREACKNLEEHWARPVDYYVEGEWLYHWVSGYHQGVIDALSEVLTE